MKKSPWQRLKDHPPILVYLYARRSLTRGSPKVAALSLEEVSIGAAIPLGRVTDISWQTDWNGISIPEAERFCAACNFDPLNANDRNRNNTYIRVCQSNPASLYAYLKKSPLWKTEFLPRLKLLKSRTISSSGSARATALTQKKQ